MTGRTGAQVWGVSTDTEAAPVEGARPAGRRSWRPWVFLLVALLIAGGVLAGVLLSRGSSNEVSSQQLAQIQQACTQWRASASAPATPSTWCTDMTRWMSNRMNDHPGMWASPEAMQTTCQDWSAADLEGASQGYQQSWCNDMVTWMQQHAAQWGSWNGWMMHGPMMGLTPGSKEQPPAVTF